MPLRKAIELAMGGDEMIDVGERLKQLMDERGLNMYTLAKRSNLSWNTIKNFYSRQTKPTITTISMLCDGLGMTVAQFFDVDGNTAHLTAKQQHLIDRWNAISDQERRLISEMLDIMLDHK